MQISTLAASICALFGVLHAPSALANERPITGYTWVGPESADIVEPGSHTSKIIFLNRCLGGCTIYGGYNDSRRNIASAFSRNPNDMTTVSPWIKGDEQWDDLVQCVQALYDPYDVIITDVDPGPEVEHFEAIVAGTAAELGLPAQVGGIAPFSCGIINNAITFSFANASFYADGIKSICETVGQETAHAFGLEHEYLCTDPMTYLPDCGPKWFQDTNASCGEYSARACDCGVNQNSHRALMDHFGPGDSPGPKLEFVRPLPNTNVQPGFVIEVSSDKYFYDVEFVELFVDGQSLGTSSSRPYIFNSPEGVDGTTSIEVRARDIRGVESSQSIEVNVGEACTVGDCPAGRACYRGYCVADNSVEGGFGAACTSNEVCQMSVCAQDSDGNGTCTAECELGAGECPEGFGCLEAGSTNVCWPGVKEGDSGGCGCQTGDHKGGLLSLLLIGLGVFLTRRRRY